MGGERGGRHRRADRSQHQLANLTVSVGGSPRSLAYGAGSIWVANAPDHFVSRVDASAATVQGQPIAIGPRPSDVAVGAGSVWVLEDRGGHLHRIDPGAGATIGRPIEVGSQPGGLAVGGGSAWVTRKATTWCSASTHRPEIGSARRFRSVIGLSTRRWASTRCGALTPARGRSVGSRPRPATYQSLGRVHDKHRRGPGRQCRDVQNDRGGATARDRAVTECRCGSPVQPTSAASGSAAGLRSRSGRRGPVRVS